MNQPLNRRRPGADAVYALTKRSIDDLARLVLDLSDHRDRGLDAGLEDARDKEAYDALDDARQLAVELCVLWDRLWASIGDGRPDPLLWADRGYSAIDLDGEDLFIERGGGDDGFICSVRE